MAIPKTEKDRIKSYLGAIRTQLEMLEHDLEVDHIPNVYATLSVMKANVSEITDTTARKLYLAWQKHDID